MVKKNDSQPSISCADMSEFHPLKDSEREILIKNNNKAQYWDQIRVHNLFDPRLVYQCNFFGEIFIGALKEGYLDHEGFSLPIGLFNSTFINCSIGHFSAINMLHYCANCNIGSEVIIHNTGEITNCLNARFGNGAILQTERHDQYKWLNLINENGGRRVLPFDTMTCSDAFIWVKYPQDHHLMERLRDITNQSCSEKIGCKGLIGHESVIKNVKSINNAWIENNTIIDGADKISNCTIRSDDLQPTKAGTGIMLFDSILGFGNQIGSGAQLHSVVTGNNVSISQVSRISHSFIADNCTIACCEIAHSLIFPSHAQHHNNSFLIAALIGGQSNIAAGATIGSNHNSRVNDGEIWASRGFWAGLCTSFKHNSRFASYTMSVKGDYPFELDIPFPFSLIINDCSNNSLLIMPGYWFSNNMYALIRSHYKFTLRDKRIHKDQIIEHDPLAPDTIEEIFSAITILEQVAGELWYIQNKKDPVSIDDYQKKGKELFHSDNYFPDHFEFPKNTIEKGNRPVQINKPAQAWKIYRDMICWYAVKTLINYPEIHKVNLNSLIKGQRERCWINCGGQIIRKTDLKKILSKIKTDKTISTWQDIHKLFNKCHEDYEMHKINHAAACLLALMPEESYSSEQYYSLLKKTVDISKWIVQSTRSIRLKDYSDHFNTMIYEHAGEMQTVLGDVEDDKTIQNIKDETDGLISKINEICKHLS